MGSAANLILMIPYLARAGRQAGQHAHNCTLAQKCLHLALTYFHLTAKRPSVNKKFNVACLDISGIAPFKCDECLWLLIVAAITIKIELL